MRTRLDVHESQIIITHSSHDAGSAPQRRNFSILNPDPSAVEKTVIVIKPKIHNAGAFQKEPTFFREEKIEAT